MRITSWLWPTKEPRLTFRGASDSPMHLPELLRRKPFWHRHLNDPGELTHLPPTPQVSSTSFSHSLISAPEGKQTRKHILWISASQAKKCKKSYNLPKHRVPINRNPWWHWHIASVALARLMHNCSHSLASWISQCCSFGSSDECFNFGLISLHNGLCPSQRRFLQIKFRFLMGDFRLNFLTSLKPSRQWYSASRKLFSIPNISFLW